MIATDANVSRILIARQADSYLPGNISAGRGGGRGSEGAGAGVLQVGGGQGEGCDQLTFH